MKDKERTVSRRNFVGAFWGGILGILAFGYLRSIVALPFGCFFGVVVGWWHEEIRQSVADSFRRGVSGTWFVWLLRRPTAFVQWLRAHHELNREYLHILTTVSFVGSTLLWAIPFARWCFRIADSVPKASLLGCLMTMVGISVPVIVIGYTVALGLEADETPFLRGFRRNWKQYASKGAAEFFARDLANLFLCQLSFALSVGWTMFWFIGLGGGFLLLVIVPISAMIGAVKGIYRASTRAGHWLCFGTTVVVTALTAWAARPYLADARVLWSVALFSGLASAGATESLRCSLVCFFSWSERARRVASATLGAQLTPRLDSFGKFIDRAQDRLFQALPVPV